jgi:hypothetical protein
MALTLLSVEDGYAVYEDTDGDEVLLATPLPIFRRVTLWEDFDLESAWQAALRVARKRDLWAAHPDRTTFLAELRLVIADPDEIDVVWCEACSTPVSEEGAVSVDGNTGYACQSCYEDSYTSCSDCGNTMHSDDGYYTLHEETVCSGCLDSNYHHCDDCEGYYHSSYSSDHSHGGCDCESPAQHFAMRNDGEAPLNQDERVTIALPSGMISSEGIEQIKQLLNAHAYSFATDWSLPEEERRANYDERAKWWNLANELENALGTQWQTKEGNYTKRLSKLAHKSQGLKLPQEILSQVGNIGRANSTGVDFEIEFTRDLNLPAGDFYHEESCWWQSYAEGRCSLKSNGGIGMRTFGGYRGNTVQGRAWIMPLKLDGDGELQATFDSLTPDAFVIFNGYGDLSGYAPARIVAHMAGMTYRKINFHNSPMYVNGESGYIVSSEEIAAKYAERKSLILRTSTHSTLYHSEQAAAKAA